MLKYKLVKIEDDPNSRVVQQVNTGGSNHTPAPAPVPAPAADVNGSEASPAGFHVETEEHDSGDEYGWESLKVLHMRIPLKLSLLHLVTVPLLLLTIPPVIRVPSLLALRVRCHPLFHLWPAHRLGP